MMWTSTRAIAVSCSSGALGEDVETQVRGGRPGDRTAAPLHPEDGTPGGVARQHGSALEAHAVAGDRVGCHVVASAQPGPGWSTDQPGGGAGAGPGYRTAQVGDDRRAPVAGAAVAGCGGGRSIEGWIALLHPLVAVPVVGQGGRGQ